MAGEIYMRRDCIDAVQTFLEKTEALPYVSVGIEGQYISDRNEFRDKSKKEGKTEQDRGTQLCFTFGGGDRDRTVYAFRLKDFTAKENRSARSIRFAPDGGKEAVIVSESGPGGGLRDSVADKQRADKMYRNTCMAANSLSFGSMFYGWSDNVIAGTKEADAAMSVLDDRTGGGWAAVRENLGGSDGLKAMAAWGVMSEALDEQVKPGDPRFGQLVSVASQAMGLEGLYASLESINKQMVANPDYKPDMSIYMDPDTDAGRVALRGLMSLAAYKQVKDRGGMDLIDEHGDPVVAVTPANHMVFEKLVYARGDMDERNRPLAEAEAGRSGICAIHSVQKTFAGINSPDGAKPDELRGHQKYRLTRAALLGEDPDMPSGAPVFKLSAAKGEDLSKLNERSIMVSSDLFPDAIKRVPLETFLDSGLDSPDSEFGQVLRALPAMKYAAERVGGIGTLGAMAAKQLQSSGGEPVDGLCLEMAAFQSDKACKGIMRKKGSDGLTGDDLCAQFQVNAKAARDPAPNLMRNIYEAVGRPDFATGQMSIGAKYKADLSNEGGYDLSAPDVGCNTRAASAAKVFRAMDKERTAFVDAAYGASGIAPKNMGEAEDAFPSQYSAGMYKRLLSEYRDEQQKDPERGSMMLNDFIVMAECYGISDATHLRMLGSDIRDAYNGTGSIGYYRPADGVEHEVLREAYAKGGGESANALTPFSQQREKNAMLFVLMGAQPDKDCLARIKEKIERAAADRDTFDDHKNWDLVHNIDSAVTERSSLAMEAERQAQAIDAKSGGKSADRDITE